MGMEGGRARRRAQCEKKKGGGRASVGRRRAVSRPAVTRVALRPPLQFKKKVTDDNTTRSSDAPAHHRIGNDGPHEIAKPSTCASSTTIIILQKMLLGSCPSEPDCNQLGYGPPSEQRPWHLFFVHRGECFVQNEETE